MEGFYTPACGYIGNMSPKLGTVKDSEAQLKALSIRERKSKSADFIAFYDAYDNPTGDIYKDNNYNITIVTVGNMSCFAKEGSQDFYKCKVKADDVEFVADGSGIYIK